MRKKKGLFSKSAAVLAAAVLLYSMSNSVYSDEGMWLYEEPPKDILKDRYSFDLTDSWLEHLRLSSVRFNNGGSGSFASEDGLVVTNHHVGAGALEKLSTAQSNLLNDGFNARTLDEELRCHDLELNVLVRMEDVTEKVNAAVVPEMSVDEAVKARRMVMSELEAEALKTTGLRSDVVTLFQGGRYMLYQYKRYTDVRLVFAPEEQIGFFGGDPDNFEYPRYNLDVCIFRVYEEGKPAHIDHYLKWTEADLTEGDLVFVSGHPGSTSRLITMSELEYERDVLLPYTLERLNRLEVLYTVWAARSDENNRRAGQSIMGVQNGRKALSGGYNGLLDPELLKAKQTEEKEFLAQVLKSDQFKNVPASFEKIAQADKDSRKDYEAWRLLEGGHAFNSSYFNIARTLLRYADEVQKPNGERLREFRDSNKVSLELGLFSEAPIYDDFELLRLTDGLRFLILKLGYNNPLVQKILDNKSPEELALELISGTCVKSVEKRREIYAMTPEEIAQLKDPMIELARLVDEPSRQLRTFYEKQAEIKKQAHEVIAGARFALSQGSVYPDATFTLRLAFGAVKGYEEGGTHIPFSTQIEGMYRHGEEHGFKPPFKLPQSWMDSRQKVDGKTPCNFVCTADIIGGNSGSPVVNREGEFVGIIFDGNIQSLVWDYIYSDRQGRAVSVCSEFILEGLRSVYGAGNLADEILTGKRAEQ